MLFDLYHRQARTGAIFGSGKLFVHSYRILVQGGEKRINKTLEYVLQKFKNFFPHFR